MRPEQAWASFSLVFALGCVAAAAALVSLGHDPYQVGMVVAVAVAVYLYVVYKRYHIELITEGDIAQFSDPEDLRILCEIYGLGGTGRPLIDRQRLKNLVRAHPGAAFVWIAPRPVRSVGSVLAVPLPEPEEELTVPVLVKRLLSDRPSESALRGSLIWDADRSAVGARALDECPVCEWELLEPAQVCPECGADLGFYSTLAESRLGRRLISEKTVHRRRKAR